MTLGLAAAIVLACVVVQGFFSGGGGGTPCASYSRERASKLGSMKMGVPASQYMMLTSQLPREPMTAVAAPKAAATSRSGMPR